MWEGLQNRYEMGLKQSPLSEQEFVDAAIRFANAGNAAAEWLALTMGVRMPWNLQPTTLTPFESERATFRSALGEIATGNSLKNPGAIADAGRMVLIPRANLKGRKLRIKYWYLPLDLPAALAYALLLLADQTKGHGRNLRQCQLDQCQKFFFIQRPKTGRPRTKYCSDEHMHKAHQASASQRVRKSREIRRANQRKKGAKRARW